MGGDGDVTTGATAGVPNAARAQIHPPSAGCWDLRRVELQEPAYPASCWTCNVSSTSSVCLISAAHGFILPAMTSTF